MVKLLLIEPDVLLAKIYGAALTNSGYDVSHRYTAQSAIALADENCPDLVIIELQLAGHNGLEFLYEFRSYTDWKQIPVVIHSSVSPASFSGSWEVMTDELGVVAYLPKMQTSLRKLIHAVANIIPATTR